MAVRFSISRSIISDCNTSTGYNNNIYYTNIHKWYKFTACQAWTFVFMPAIHYGLYTSSHYARVHTYILYTARRIYFYHHIYKRIRYLKIISFQCVPRGVCIIDMYDQVP